MVVFVVLQHIAYFIHGCFEMSTFKARMRGAFDGGA
jgi:hypothetical protein